ncbi:MAG: DUF4339 domain-containing protein [Rariglobus sp.]
MPSAPRYYLAEAGQRTGPHSLAVLKQLAEVGTITPDTLHAAESEPNDWTPLRDSQVLHDELFPARPHYTLDANRPVEHVNHPDNTAVPSVDEMLRANIARQRAAEGELLTPQPPRSNKRRRDYLFLVIAGNALGLLVFILLPSNPLVLVYLLAFFVIYNLGLAWTLYGVMDRY